MKATIYKETFHYYLTSHLNSIGDGNCNTWLSEIICQSSSDESWSNLLFATELVFDDIEYFEPEVSSINIETSKAAREMRDFFGSKKDKKYGLKSKKKIKKKLLKAGLEASNVDVLYGCLTPQKDFFENSIDGLFLSPDPYINQLYLSKVNKLTPENIISILAVSGITTCFPAIQCTDQHASRDMLAILREKFEGERLEYISYLRKYTTDVYLAVKAGDFQDAWEFASYKSSPELKALAEKLEAAISKGDSKLLKRVRVFSSESVLGIASSVLNKEKRLIKATAVETLKVLSGSLAKEMEVKRILSKHPEMSYIYHIVNVNK